MPKLSGLAVPYRSTSGDLGFYERFEPGAFGDVRKIEAFALHEHDIQRLLGRTGNGTLKLTDTPAGIRADIDLPNTTCANDLVISVRRRDVRGMSFRFEIEPGGERWSKTTIDGKEVALRTITKAKLFEVSVVCQPAYPQTSVRIVEDDPRRMRLDLEEKRFAYLEDRGIIDNIKNFFGGGGKRDPDDIARDEGGRFAPTDSSGVPSGSALTVEMKKGAKIGPHGFPILKVDGKEYLVKAGPFMKGRDVSHEEAMSAQFAQDAGVDVAPTAVRKVNGGDRVVTEYLRDAVSVYDMPEADRITAFSKIPTVEFEKQILFDYVVGNTDQNDGNYLIKGDRFIGIDKEFSLEARKGFEATTIGMPGYLEYVDDSPGGMGFTFSKEIIDKMADAGDKIADKLEKDKHKGAQGVRDRVKILRTFSNTPGRSAQTLQYLGQWGPHT